VVVMLVGLFLAHTSAASPAHRAKRESLYAALERHPYGERGLSLYRIGKRRLAYPFWSNGEPIDDKRFVKYANYDY